MVTKELVDYIKKELKKNTPIDAIHAMLKRHSWGDTAINEGLRLALQDPTLLSKTLHLSNDNTIEIPKSRELLKLAFLEYKERFKVYSIIASLPMVISLLIQFVTKFIGVNTTNLESLIVGNKLMLVIILMWFVIILIFLIIVQIFTYAAFLVALRDRYSKPSIGDAYKLGVKYIWPLMLVGILFALWVVLGVFIFIIPALLFALWYAFSGFVVVEAGLRGNKALAKSKSLVKGKWWKIYWRVSFISIISVGLQACVSLVLNLIPLPFLKEIGQALLGLALTCISTIYLYFLYEKLKALAE